MLSYSRACIHSNWVVNSLSHGHGFCDSRVFAHEPGPHIAMFACYDIMVSAEILLLAHKGGLVALALQPEGWESRSPGVQESSLAMHP